MRAWRLTSEVGACAVGSQVPAICVGCVTLEQTLVLRLHFGDVEHSWVTAQPLHIDLFAVHSLGVNSVGIVRLSRANDADLPVGRWRQVHGPLKVLLHPLFVARHVAPDGHMRALGPYQRPTLHRYHSLSHGNIGYRQALRWERWRERGERGPERMGWRPERERRENMGYKTAV